MGRLPRLLCCLFLSLSLAGFARAAMRYQEWEISNQFKSPDCVRKLVEHDVLRNNWWHKITYEQAAGLASVPLVWVGKLQSLLINGRGMLVNCSAMAAGPCNAVLPECASPVVEPDAEPFTYDGEHDGMLLNYCRELNYC